MKIVLGTMTFGEQMGSDVAARAVAKFVEAADGELDTAFMYGGGETELVIGEILNNRKNGKITLATKAHPKSAIGIPSLAPDEVVRQLNVSLSRLGQDSVNLFYLHSPDNNTPLERTLSACAQLHSEGKFQRLGLSNYAAWQVIDIFHICHRHGWPLPEVYQGMYNVVTRDVEKELIPCLRHLGISFYAYNPLAGGLLTGRYSNSTAAPTSGRFQRFSGYMPRYWKKSYLEAMEKIGASIKQVNISMTTGALSWLYHHSKLDSDLGDAIIIGASTLDQLSANLSACNNGPLEDSLVNVFNAAWQYCQVDCPVYFR